MAAAPAKEKPQGRLRGAAPPLLLLLLAAPPLLFLSFSDGVWNPPAASPPNAAAEWIRAQPESNFTATLVSRWQAAGGEACGGGATGNVSIPGLDGGGAAVPLAAGPVLEFAVFSVDELGRRRCAGGDYFEADLTGPRWKARPAVADHGDGSYTLRLQVHPDFAGEYNLTLVLLFRSFQGLRLSTQRFALRRRLRRIPLLLRAAAQPPPPPLRRCGPNDFRRRRAWSGRWTRHGGADGCEPGPDGRYRCLPPAAPCPPPWCGGGALAALESNGWVYSAHCAFSVYSPAAAWRCLRGRWLFFWGDSNHVDTIRNLLTFALAAPPEAAAVRRRFDRRFANPGNATEWVRITSVFNGHWNESGNYEGLASLRHPGFRALTRRYFDEPGGAPDVVVLNSGLHDGVFWRSLRGYVAAAEDAAGFWADILSGLRARPGPGPGPAVFYRTTVAVGGYARALSFNPQKMEAFNGVMVEKLSDHGVLTGGVIDHFDMTFPWHWDTRCSDGLHYGRPPSQTRWRDGLVGHHYFVDLMLVHVILAAVCPNN
ncbi:cytochrome P450 family protein [Wolffia australiana]